MEKQTQNTTYQQITKKSHNALIDTYVDMKILEIQSHIPYAEKMGYFDNVCNNYSKQQAYDYLDTCETYLIRLSDEKQTIAGFFQIAPNDAFDQNGITLDNIYVKDEFRSLGIAKQVIEMLTEKHESIILECFYGIPALELWKKLGFREIAKVMTNKKQKGDNYDKWNIVSHY